MSEREHSDTSLASVMATLGFHMEPRQTWSLWRHAMATAAPRAGKTSPPWHVDHFEVAERKGTLHLHRLAMSLDVPRLRTNLAALTRKHFGIRTVGEFATGRRGEIHCLFEFSRPGSREKQEGEMPVAGAPVPGGIAGFSLRFVLDGTTVQLLLGDHFAIGYVPSSFAAATLRFVSEGLGLRAALPVLDVEYRPESIYELRFPLTDVALLAITGWEGAADKDARELRTLLTRTRAPLNSGAEREMTEGGTWRFVVTAEQSAPIEAAKRDQGMPLEVLESRELSARYREIDHAILASKFGRAAEMLAERLADAGDSRYLLRRQALLAVVGHAHSTSHGDRALALEDDHPLFLSQSLTLALTAGDQTRVLALLSRLGAALTRRIVNAESLTSFDVVLPEILGDAWCAEDPIKAEECYQRIIQRRGDMPRILRKMINLARQTGRNEIEIAYLGRLAAVERRRTELAKIYHRLAELRRPFENGRQEAIQLALQALQCDRHHYGSALLAATLLTEAGQSQDAIQLLDSLLNDAVVNMPARAKSRIEAAIGSIWRQSLGRADLAEARYESAVGFDGENLDALRELESLYRQGGRHKGLATVLETQFDLVERRGDGEALRQIFDELVALYRGVLGQPRRAFELYQRLLSSATVEPEEIDRVLAWRDVEIDWTDLYVKLQSKLPGMPAGRRRAAFLCRLAEICRDRLRNQRSAVAHLRQALDEGWIDAGGFRYLVERLSEEKDQAELVRCYELRLEQAPASERFQLITELLNFPGVLSDPRCDQLAVQALLLAEDGGRVVQQRFRTYQSVDDTDAIDRLLTLLLEEKTLSNGQRGRWVRQAIDALAACHDEQRFTLLDRAFRRLLDLSEDLVLVLQEAIEALQGAADSSGLVFYISKLLDAGLLPALEEKQVVRVLNGKDHELALYHQLMAFKTTQPELAAVHARTAAALYAVRAKQEHNTEKMLGRLCTLVPVADEDLKQLRTLVEHTGNWPLLARALQKQADSEDERQRKYSLLEQLGIVYWKRLKDFNRARLTFVLAMKQAKEPHKIKLILANVAYDAGDAKHERKALADFLHDPACITDAKAINQAVQRLLKLGEEGAAVQKLLQPHIDAASEGRKHDVAGRLSNILLDNQIATTELYTTAFKAAVDSRDEARAVEIWWRGLACVSNKSKAKAYMAETKLTLEREERRELLIDCFQAALDNDVGDRLGPMIKREILVQYGALLFDSDSKRRKAMAIYQEAFTADRDDNRTWMPLYFLFLEFGSPAQRLEYLQEIIPKLQVDPRPLKSFPITIESLQAELQELETQMGGDASSAIKERDFLQKGVDLNLDAAPVQVPNDLAAQVSGAMAFRAAAGSGFVPADPGFASPESREGSGLALVDAASGLPALPLDDAPAPAVSDDEPAVQLDLVGGEEPVVEYVPGAQDPGAFQLSEVSEVSLVGLEGGESLPAMPDDAPVFVMADAPVAASPEPTLPIDNSGYGAIMDDMSLASAPSGEGGFSLDLGGGEAADHSNVELGMAVAASADDAPIATDSGLPPLPEGSGGSAFPAGDASHSTEMVVVPEPPRTTGTLNTSNTNHVSVSSGHQHTGSGLSRVGNGDDVQGTDDVFDWRAAVIKNDFNADLTSKLLKQAFASEIDKHLAIQAVALVAGTCDKLANWHWRVWRKPDEYGYPLSGKDRFPSGTSSPILHSSLHKLVITAAPLFVRAFRDRYTLEHLAHRLETGVNAIEKLRKPMPWDEGLLKDVGFKLYADRIAQRRYRAFNVAGLGKEIFYEGGSRSIYLDEAYYRKAPPSHLFHRIMGLLWSVRIHYFVPLALHPQKQVAPLLAEVYQHFSAQGISRLKTRLGSRSKVIKHLEGIDTRSLKNQFLKVGQPTEEGIAQLWDAMRLHVHRLLIAETLDVIGVFESMLERDLLKPGALKHSQIYEMSPNTRGLIDFVTKLKV